MSDKFGIKKYDGEPKNLSLFGPGIKRLTFLSSVNFKEKILSNLSGVEKTEVEKIKERLRRGIASGLLERKLRGELKRQIGILEKR